MSKIEQAKSYTGSELESIFFKPLFSGSDAMDLGIRVLYNMPVPTTVHFWGHSANILQKFTSGNWNGTKAERTQKTIDMHRVKAEAGYGAEDYFGLVFERITNRSDINMEELTGTELEQAETAIFKEAIAESIRATMWLGNTERTGANPSFTTFDGFIKRIMNDVAGGEYDIAAANIVDSSDPDRGEAILKDLWDSSSNMLKDSKAQGNLVYLVSSDIYSLYEESLDSKAYENAYLAKQNGRPELSYRGIPVEDIQISRYLGKCADMPKSFALLTDRRNLVLAVNTADFPGSEVKMWYNPDQMENRQRAVFAAGCDYLIPEMISVAFKS